MRWPTLDIGKQSSKENSNGSPAHWPPQMVLEDDGEVKIYYGAADTVMCLATTSVDELLRLCLD